MTAPLYFPDQLGADCGRCYLREHRQGPPVGPELNPNAFAAVVGEAPGSTEVETGHPFTGKSGNEATVGFGIHGVRRSHLSWHNTLACLDPFTLVRLADGTYQKIITLVANKYVGKVLTIGPQGVLTVASVVGWYKNERADRAMLRVTTAFGRNTPNGPSGVTLTEDHKLLTTRGWVKARDLLQNERIATGDRQPVGRGASVAVGSLLGDGHISKAANCLIVSQLSSNSDFVHDKATCLSPMRVTLYETATLAMAERGAQPQTAFRTAASRYWRELRAAWYPRGKKIVPRDIVIDDMALAVWFMDDGDLNVRERRLHRASFATCAFTQEDCEFLASRLRALGMEDARAALRVRHWRVVLGPIGTERLAARIARYVPLSMQYKLPEYHRGKFESALYTATETACYYDAAKIEPAATAPSNSVYCIGVEGTHNFVVGGGIVVKNCHPPDDNLDLLLHKFQRENKRREKLGLDKLPTPHECCKPRLDRELAGVQNIITMGRTAANAVLGQNRSIMDIRGGPVTLDDGRRVMPTVHPAFVMRMRRWTRAYRTDLGRAVRWFSGSLMWREPKVTYNPSPAVLRAFLTPKRAYSYDVETKSPFPGRPELAKDPLLARLGLLGIATDDEVMVIGFLGVDGRTKFYTQRDEAEIIEIVRWWGEDPDKLKIDFNGYYDFQVVKWNLGILLSPRLDNILQHRNVEPELPHGLAYVASTYAEIPRAWKVDHAGTDAETDAEWMEYNAIDCILEHRITAPLAESIKIRNAEVPLAMHHAIQRYCIGLHENGIWINQAHRAKWDVQLRSEAVQKLRLVKDSMKALGMDERYVQDFNPGSVEQLKDLFFSRWGLIPVDYSKKTGEPSTGDETIRSFMRDPKLRDGQKLFFRGLRGFRATTKARGTYVRRMVHFQQLVHKDPLSVDDDEDETTRDEALARKVRATSSRVSKAKGTYGLILGDGRVHANWNAHSVSTGWRLSSSDPNCFDAKTEVLTERGWIRFDQLTKGVKVAQWHAGSSAVTFTTPTAYIKTRAESMVSLRNEHIDLRLTPDHRCLLRHRKTGELRVFAAAEYPTNWHQLHGGEHDGRGLPLTDDELRLLLAIQADASWADQKPPAVTFKLIRSRKVDALRALLDRIPDVGYSLRVFDEVKTVPGGKQYAVKVSMFGVWNCAALDKIESYLGHAKKLGAWLLEASQAQLRLICDEVMNWDGSFDRRNNYSLSTPGNADWIQIAFLLTGRRCNVREYNGATTTKPNWQCDVTYRNYSGTTNIKKTEGATDEDVYCISVPSSYVIVRRNGKAVVTGQCQNWMRKLREIAAPQGSPLNVVQEATARGDWHLPNGEPIRVYLDADQDQGEMRIIAALAGLGRLLEAFKTSKDPHAINGEAFFGAIFTKAVGKDWDRLRDFSKTAFYALAYKAAFETAYETITSAEDADGNLPFVGYTQRQVRAIIDRFMMMNPELEKWWEAELELYRRQGFLTDPLFGYRCDFLDGEDPNRIVNFRSQSLLGAIVQKAAVQLVDGPGAPLQFGRYGHGTGLVNQGHDRLDFEWPVFHARKFVAKNKKGEETPNFGWCEPGCPCPLEKARQQITEAMHQRVPGLDVQFQGKAQVAVGAWH